MHTLYKRAVILHNRRNGLGNNPKHRWHALIMSVVELHLGNEKAEHAAHILETLRLPNSIRVTVVSKLCTVFPHIEVVHLTVVAIEQTPDVHKPCILVITLNRSPIHAQCMHIYILPGCCPSDVDKNLCKSALRAHTTPSPCSPIQSSPLPPTIVVHIHTPPPHLDLSTIVI